MHRGPRPGQVVKRPTHYPPLSPDLVAFNSIVQFHRASAPVAPDVHPAALAAAQLLFVNGVPTEDFEAAVAFFRGLSEEA